MEKTEHLILQTENFLLRPFVEEDAPDVYNYAKNSDVGPMAGWAPHKSLEESLDIVRIFIATKDIIWAIVDKQNNKVIGSIGLHNTSRRFVTIKCKTLGYVLSKDYWGRGIMVETCKEVIKFAFDKLQLDLLEVAHFSFNNRSRRVIEKLGFSYDGQTDNFYEKDGKLYGELCYSQINKKTQNPILLKKG